MTTKSTEANGMEPKGGEPPMTVASPMSRKDRSTLLADVMAVVTEMIPEMLQKEARARCDRDAATRQYLDGIGRKIKGFVDEAREWWERVEERRSWDETFRAMFQVKWMQAGLGPETLDTCADIAEQIARRAIEKRRNAFKVTPPAGKESAAGKEAAPPTVQ